MAASVSRREARERAIELLYESQICDVSIEDLIDGQNVELDDFVLELIKSCDQNSEKVLSQISELSDDWDLDRMPIMDVIILRVGIAEIQAGETPNGVVISEAVDLATIYSTDNSPKFINGILSAVVAA